MRYTGVATSYIFTYDMNNTIKFNTRDEQKEYFNLNTLFNNALSIINFNFGDGLNASVTVNNKDNIYKHLNYNYFILKDNADNVNIDYYYYYIVDYIYNTAGQITYKLKLDVLQTYYIDCNFTDCLILRAHLNRFLPKENNTVTFNYLKNSPLFEPESDVVTVKRLVSRKKTAIIIKSSTTTKEELYKWLFENVEYWVYIYLSKGEYKAYTQTGDISINMVANNIIYEEFTDTGVKGGVNGSTAIFCYPVMKYGKRSSINIKSSNGLVFSWNDVGYNDFLVNNEALTDRIYNIKISKMPPILEVSNVEYTINTVAIIRNVLVINAVSAGDFIYFGNLRVWRANNNTIPDGTCIVTVERQNLNLKGEITAYTNGVEFEELQKTFIINDIITDSNNKKYNPKLQSIEYMELSVGVGTGDGYAYDPQKLGLQPFSFNYVEPFTAEISKFYIAYIPKNTEEIYTKDSITSYTGYIGSNDTSIPYNNNQYATFISQNKNFWLQKQIDRTETAVKGLVGGATSGGILGMVTGAVGGVANAGMDFLRTNLMVDNMRASKQELKNAQGNIVFNSFIQDIGVTLELYRAVDFELEKANDKMVLYGYKYNRIDNIKNVDNIRVVHNFVMGIVEYITASYPLSSIIIQEFKRLFAVGVRIWQNTENIGNIRASNYERSLINGV